MAGGLRETLASNKRRIAVGAVALVAVGIAVAVAVGALGAPSVADTQHSFGETTETETVIETDLVIHNPNLFGISLENVTVNYSIAMNDVHMADGGLSGIEIGRGNTTTDLETTMRNEAITDWWPRHVDAGEATDVVVDVTLTTDRFDRQVEYTHSTEIDTDILADFNTDETREIGGNGVGTADPMLYVNETSAEWGQVTETETPMAKEFDVYNPNLEPYVLTRLGYEITMNDVAVGEGETEREHVIEGHSHETIPLTTAIDAERLDEWWATHLDEAVHGHQVSDLRIEFWAIIELPTGDEITVDLAPLTYEEFIGTDIFDEGGDVGVPPDSAEAGEEDDPDDSTSDDTEKNGNGEDTDEDDTDPDDEPDDDEADDDDVDDDPDDDGDEDDSILDDALP